MSKLLKVVYSAVIIERQYIFTINKKTFPVYNIFHGEISDEDALFQAGERIKRRLEGKDNITSLSITSNLMELSEDHAWMVHTFD